jgi:hypothetical protein
MSNILRQYYQGITRQLRSEVDFINSLFQHQGVKGEGNETALRDLIVNFIPNRYGVGTGIVVDRHGNHSNQCDIVIYDTFLYPSLLSLTHAHLYPVDLVYATIEVKTTLNVQSAAEALQNIASVRRLDYIQQDFGVLSTDDAAFVGGIARSTPPMGFVFAYNSTAVQDNTFRDWFAVPENGDISLYPSLVGCLDMGMMGFRPQHLPEETGAIATHPEKGMILQCLTLPVVRAKEGVTEISSPADVEFPKLATAKDVFVLEGSTCPTKKIGDDYMPIDQGRVLLNFLLRLHDFLALKRIIPDINFSSTYLTTIDQFHFVC